MNKLNQNFREVLLTITKSDKPMTITEMVESIQVLKESTAFMIVKNLLTMEYIELAGKVKEYRWVNTYAPTQKAFDYFNEEMLQNFHDLKGILAKETILEMVCQTYDL